MFVSYKDRSISVDGSTWETGHLIKDVFQLGEILFVIFDYRAYEKSVPAKNLVAYTKNGDLIWAAENPTEAGSDGYIHFIDKMDGALWVRNFNGYECRIDLSNGRILEKTLIAV